MSGMEEHIEHSRLLKFFKRSGRDTPEMAEAPIIKIEKDYQSPTNVESEVPGTHKIRELDDKNTSTDINNSSDITSEIKITEAEFTLSPVITVTKKESTLTKGDMKSQKVTITEDIAVDDSENGGHRVTLEFESLTSTESQPDSCAAITRDKRRVEKMEGEEKSQDERKSKIPMLRLRQAVEKVKRERQAQKATEQPRRSSIPKLKDAKKAVKRDTSLKFEPRVEDEFDKIYEEIVDNKQKDIDDKILALPIEDPDKIETKFEEIIHAYDENEHEKHTVSRISKIPGLRRKDDGPSRIKSLVDSVKEKNTAETKLKDGGFKVTASTIKTKRFSRGNSRDLSKEEQHIEVTQTIDIKESGDNDVFVNETLKRAPVKPERTLRDTKRPIRDDHKVNTVETIEHTEDGNIHNIVTETVETKDGVHKSKKITRVFSRDIKEKSQYKDLGKKLEDFRKKRLKNANEDTETAQELKDGESHIIATETTVTENIEATPVKTERIIRNVSKEINEDGQNISNTETVTIQDLKDGGTHTITTKTIVTESMIVGAPVRTEKVVRNISRIISTEGQNDSIKGVITTEETTSKGGKKITKETFVKENPKGIPVKTERFTRGISREMGNIKQKTNKHKETGPAEENQKTDKNIVSEKETMKTEKIEKEDAKIDKPVFTRVTRSFSKGKIHNVEMSRSIEWKPADQVKTKKYSRSVSEKVTKNELKDNDNLKFETRSVAISDKPIAEIDIKNNITCSQTKTPKDPVIEEKIKDTVKDIARNIITKKVTEYKSEEQVTNVEKNTFTLNKTVDLTIDNDLKVSKVIGTQMSVDGKTVDSSFDRDFKVSKEFGTQMSVEPGKTIDLSVEREFKAFKEIGTQMSVESKLKPVEFAADKDLKAPKDFGTQMTAEGKKSVSTVDRDSVVLREIGTQMSMEGISTNSFKDVNTQNSLGDTKDIQEDDSMKFSEGYDIEQVKESITTVSVEKSEKEHSNLSGQEKDSDTEVVTILKGNVNRMKDKIAKENVVVSKKETDEELPKDKSVLSKIAIFERLEPREPFPVIPIPGRIKCKYVPPSAYQTNSEENAKIVKEVRKEQPLLESLGDRNKVEIALNYDEVTYINEPVIVKEFWKTEKSLGPNMITEKTTVYQREGTTASVNKQKESDDWETAKTLPETIDIRTEESQIVFDTTLPEQKEIKTNIEQFENATILPEEIDIDSHESTTEEIIRTISDEAPSSITGKLDYEAEIGKRKPGKINLNKWNNQVEVNKRFVDKISVVRGEHLHEIAKTLPGKVEFPKHKDLPGKIDFKVENPNQIPKSFESQEIQFEGTKILPGNREYLIGNIHYKTDSIESRLGENLPSSNDYKINDYQLLYDVEPLPEKNDLKSYEIQTEIATILPGNTDLDDNRTQVEIAKPLQSVETSEKESSVAKPKPGKINFNLWKNQVEANKTLVSKTSIKKSKEADIAKAFPGKVDFKTHDKQDRVSEHGNYAFNRREHKVEIAKTSPDHIDLRTIKGHNTTALNSTETNFEPIKALPGTINFITESRHVEVVTKPLENIEFSATEAKVEEITYPGYIAESKTIEGKIDHEMEFEIYESKAEISEPLQDNIYISTTENQTEGIYILPGEKYLDKDDRVEYPKPLPGKLDLKAWENQVHTKVDLDTDKNGEDYDLKNKGYKVEIPSESDHVESLSDPDLVDDDPDVEVPLNKNYLIGNIKRKLYFVTNSNSSSLNTNTSKETISVVSTEDSDYEKRVEELQTKTYSINDIGKETKQTISVSSVSSITTEKTYERKTVDVEESYPHIMTVNNSDISTTEYELSGKTNTVQNELARSISAYSTDDIISSPDFKRTKSLFETSEHKVSNTEKVTNKNEFNFNTAKDQNDITRNTYSEDDVIMSTDEYKITNTVYDNVIDENGFNFNVNRNQNKLTTSAYGADDFKTGTEELQRAKSLAELDLGDVIHGQVRRMVGRIKSVDFGRRESIKTEINVKELPKKMTVLEKIALFEVIT